MKTTSFEWLGLCLWLAGGLGLLASDPTGGASVEAAGGVAQAEGITGPLLNINFTASANGQYVVKKGGAAVGLAADDFWNVYSRDDGRGGFSPDGILRELKYADQQPSGATLVVSNAAGAWMNGAADPMFDWYLYPLGRGEIKLTLTELAPGNYDFYIFGHGALDDQNGIYEVISGGTNYGTKATTTGPGWINPSLAEGQQYVRFDHVRVTPNTPVSITAKVGTSGYALISGIQILSQTEAVAPNDGIPAAWRIRYFGTVDDPRALATADPDGDGANNYQEYLSGTNPLDAQSVSRVPVSIETYAGSVAGGRDGTLAEATFTVPVCVRPDRQGRLWVCESTWTDWTQALVGGHRIRVIDPVAGTVTTLAGSAEPGYVDGPAAAARFTAPSAVVFDRQGNAFITERLGHRIRKIDRNGIVSTFAGSQAGNRDGRGTSAMFHSPSGTVIDANDNLYVADFDNYSIRKITPDGSVTTLTGNGAGDVDGDLKTARFNTPNFLALKADGTLFAADWVNGKIRVITPAGLVKTFASGLTYIEEVALDTADHVYASLPDGPVLNQYDLNGRLLWSLAVPNGYRDGPVAEAMAGRFNDLEFLPDGQVLFPDGANNRIRRLTMEPPPLLTVAPAGGLFTGQTQVRLSTIVTNGLMRYTLDGTEPASGSALYSVPLVLTSSATVKARVFINGIPVSSILTAVFQRADVVNPPDGIPADWRVKYFGSVNDPRALATADPDGDGANNYQEYLSGTNPLDALSVPRVPVSIETYAGSEAGSRDGTLAEATFTSPSCFRRDPQGRFWVTEATWAAWTTPLVGAHRIRIIDPVAGTVTTLAGSAEPGYVDGPVARARFTTPMGVVFDRQGNAFISERLGNRIRKIDRNGIVSTFAGSQAGNRDGRGTSAMFHTLQETVIDANDNLYTADFDNYSIRKIAPDGSVTTLTGNGPGDWDGDLRTARFNSPAGMALKSDGTLFVADWANSKVRQISPQGQVTTFLSGLTYVEAVALDAANRLYVSVPEGPGLRQYDLQGQLAWSLDVPSGFRDGPVAEAMVGKFNELEFLPDGEIFFPDGAHNRIRHLTMGLPPLLTMSPAGGSFTNKTQVNLTTIASNGWIHYTLDGTEPENSSTLYGGSLVLTSSTTVKARVFVNGIPVSAIMTAAFQRTDGVNPADGIPAEWRIKYFGSVNDPRALATADPDGDGANNYQEYLSGTSPLDALSVPRVPVSIETYAGSEAGSRDGTLAEATFTSPSSFRRDFQGRFWVAEATWAPWTTPLVGAHRIRIIDPAAGTVTTLAGSAEPGYVDGPAARARFITPVGVVFDRQGNAFVTERLGNRIRKIDRNGIVSTFAGSQAGNRDGRGTNAMFHTLQETVIDANDNLYTADFDNYSIRKITPDGSVTTLTGNGPGDLNGDLKTARFNSPAGMTLKSDGTLFVADWVNGEIRQISPQGQVTTLLAGLTYVEGVALDAVSRLYVSLPEVPTLNQYDLKARLVWSLSVPSGFRDGPVAEAMVGRFNELELLSDGQIFFPDGANNRIRHLTMGPPALLTMAPSGGSFTNQTQVQLTTIVTNGLIRYTLDGTDPGNGSTLYGGSLMLTASATVKARVFVNEIPVSPIGTGVFSRVAGGLRIVYLPSPVTVSTLAGNGQVGSADGVGSQARFNYPNGGATDAQGNTYIADFANNKIRKVTPQGVVTTVAGTGLAGYQDGPASAAQFNGPLAVFASSSGTLYVADTGNNRIRKIDANGLVTTVAGDGTAGYLNGSSSSARFNFPNDLLLGRDGRLYVCEFNNHTVRLVDVNGMVSTLAGNGSPGYVDGAAAAARFNRPAGLALEPDGDILVSEWEGNRIRRISVNNLVSTVAGSGIAGYVDDTALSAQFRNPDGLAVAPDGTIYVADNGNNAIRCVQPNGLVVTVAGTGDAGFLDGQGALARFASPTGLGIDAAGNLVVPDYVNQRVRKITLSPSIPVALALRTLPSVYRPGVAATLPVTIVVTPPTGTTAYAVEDRLPEGWTIGAQISENGQYDAVNRTVKFGPFVDGLARTLTYEARSTINSQGVARFAGSVSVDGSQIAIGGASEIAPSVLHPADLQPADNRLSVGELTAYGAAWKRGSVWTTPPNPIPISYVTRAAYLWKNGEVYAYDPQQGEPPLCWVSGSGTLETWGVNLEPLSYPVTDPLPGTPIGSKPSAWLPLILAENEASAAMPGQYLPGQPVPVDIAVTPLSGILVYAIEDTVPEGWSVVSISGDGSFDAGAGKLKWGPYFDDAARHMSYVAIPPAGAASVASFAGTASFDGTNVKISGQRQAIPGTMTVPITLTLRTAANGSLSLSFGGWADGVYRIESSEDLIQWSPFETVTNGIGVVDLSVGAEEKPMKRFYRVVTEP